MDVGPFLVADAQASPLKQPFEARFDNVAEHSQAAAVLVAAVGDRGDDPASSQCGADLFFRVVGAVRRWINARAETGDGQEVAKAINAR